MAQSEFDPLCPAMFVAISPLKRMPRSLLELRVEATSAAIRAAGPAALDDANQIAEWRAQAQADGSLEPEQLTFALEARTTPRVREGRL